MIFKATGLPAGPEQGSRTPAATANACQFAQPPPVVRAEGNYREDPQWVGHAGGPLRRKCEGSTIACILLISVAALAGSLFLARLPKPALVSNRKVRAPMLSRHHVRTRRKGTSERWGGRRFRPTPYSACAVR
jgi:hypothetical protein